MFESIPQNVSFPAMETKILEYWQQNQIYEKSLEARQGSEPFVFYEGPPTANGMPHPGHCLTRAIKDVFPRYRTMRGYYCERKAGWDTHGLPVEVEVCKELGIHSKEEIENYGVEPFIHKCQASVWRYMQEWRRLTERLGFWVDLDDAYVTYHKSFVESVWWSLKNLYDRGLLYQGHKIVWWWAQGGTALSSGEVGQGYREVADPSVFVRFPLLDEENTALLVWTTTPWTLPSNQFAAVHPELDYATVEDEETGEKLIVAEALAEAIAAKAKRTWKVLGTTKGSELLGKRYQPPFDYYYKDLGNTQGTLKSGDKQHIAWRVVAADFVTTDSGTGVVHQAPAFGEVDYEVLANEQARFEDREGPALICAVGPDGKFTDEAPDYKGRWVKEADKDISRELKERGVLFLLDQYLHDYPFCWRAEEDPLIQYPRESWFIRTTKFKDQMLANNQQINWLPEHIKDGRFGNFLESNVDWALSRERYWGTPLPIWVCQETGKAEAVCSYAELQEKPGAAGFEVWEKAKAENPDLVDDLKIHKPYIDEITYDSPFAKGARMRRVPEVIDCWYDSGAMPFAQWGYPHQGEKNFQAQFPADFISEAIDQTRGWFYSQLAISTLLFGQDEDGKTEPHAYPHPFKNCIVLGLMLGEDGQKMSKSKRNYREPNEIFDKYGADALRWYLYANQPPWTSIRYNEQSIKDSIPEFLLRLWNVFSFFTIYANIDGFEPETSAGDLDQCLAKHFVGAKGARPVAERSELDRWVLSELNRTIQTVTERMDAYDNYNACAAINEFVDGLSNWYVRRSRDRFWSKEKESADKLDAYWTLYECLLTTCQVIAPFVPFLSETLWQNLAGVFGDKAKRSVHLCDFPTVDQSAIDTQLSQRMELLREIASLGRQARMNEKLKVRQPLSKVEVVLADDTHRQWLMSHSAILCEELNVKAVEYTQEADEYINYQIQPNFKRLGPRVGKLMPNVKKVLGQTDAAALLNALQTDGAFTLTIEGESLTFDNDDIQVRLTAKEGWAAAQGKLCVVVLNTELTPELIQEGYVKDLVRLIQDKRKELDLEYTAKIEVGVVTDSQDVQSAVTAYADYIQAETLATTVEPKAISGIEPIETKIADSEVRIFVKQA
ncbi:isoleucine--tRNA ligase [Blastopirellula marina]|uniref:Isoleucine--tRNA ligase n=1 Tax=Blastopirellula marina TaxID=124 RepID=A0A2S8F6E4_9BACT|nr:MULTISPECIES: isoleucine--tRNA ligase [Pirellulaceae]PQO27504.1 isoleucine--tRNA ligase [Blastopirellula marina]RCS48041.1 isoleucine--tRNA ligase [Bremerella cremea]